MEVISHGIDLVECDRLDGMVKRHGERIMSRLFTKLEVEYSKRHKCRIERLAGRFAVKEAVMKILGTGWRNGISWRDIETVNDANGKPEVRLSGQTASLAKDMGIEKICVSITHAGGLAVASAIALGKGK